MKQLIIKVVTIHRLKAIRVARLPLQHGIPEISLALDEYLSKEKRTLANLDHLEFSASDLADKPKMGYNPLELIPKLESAIAVATNIENKPYLK